jgi:hypothetical protein
MRFSLLILGMMILVPSLVFADNEPRLKIRGFYGITAVSPNDANNVQSSLPGTPKIGSISSGTDLGGSIMYGLGMKWEVFGSYEVQEAKNLTNISSPSVNGAGFDLKQNIVWLGLNYYLVKNNHVYFYVGAAGGYPTYAHGTLNYTTNTDYDADKQVVYEGHAGLGLMLGMRVSLFVEGGYQGTQQGALKANGVSLGKNEDLSGARGIGGIVFHL